MLDVIIVGGSYAGLAAALQLGRARRSVLVVDAGERRNRFASSAHGFLGHDGEPPGDIAARARADVLAYPTVAIQTARVTEVSGVQDDFRVVASGEVHRARRLVLATGVVDELPAIPGLRERWGTHVFHCPYCHGYELGLGRIGIVAVGAVSMHQAILASEWGAPGQVHCFLEETFVPDADQLAQLAARSIHVHRERITHVSGAHERAIDVHLAGGTTIALDGVFTLPRARIADPFAAQLGCELEQGHLGPHYKTDAMKETTVPGVFACGDVGQPMPTIAIAVADGSRAGAAAHQSLVFRKVGQTAA